MKPPLQSERSNALIKKKNVLLTRVYIIPQIENKRVNYYAL
jgi:hypothetical protein